MHDVLTGTGHVTSAVSPVEPALDLSNLPGKATQGGYVYVLAFDNGSVKVGSTTNPSDRIRTHQTSAAQFGIAIIDLWVSPEIDDHIWAEKRLIAAASRSSSGTILREWFRGVDFRALVEIAPIVISFNPEFKPAPVSPVDLLTEAKRALGVYTIAEVAAVCGLSKSTLERLVANPQNAITRNVLRFSTTTGIPLSDLLGATAAQPELSEAA